MVEFVFSYTHTHTYIYIYIYIYIYDAPFLTASYSIHAHMIYKTLLQRLLKSYMYGLTTIPHFRLHSDITYLGVVFNGCFIIACCVLFISLEFDDCCCLLALSLSCSSFSYVCLHCFHVCICYIYTMVLFQCQPKLHHHTASMKSFLRFLNTQLLYFLYSVIKKYFLKNTDAFYLVPPEIVQ